MDYPRPRRLRPPRGVGKGKEFFYALRAASACGYFGLWVGHHACKAYYVIRRFIMCIVTSRVASNVATHGVAFAVEHEVKRARRMGMGREAAITRAVELVRSSITKAGMRK